MNVRVRTEARAAEEAPGSALYGMYLLWLGVCLGGNLLWTPRLDAVDIMLAPGLLVAIGIAIARRRYQ